MRKSGLRFLGFVGLIGLLGFFTDNPGLYGFFGFFGFFGFTGMKNDELLKQNMAKAGLNAFVSSLGALTISIAVLSIVQTLEVAALCIAAVFIIQLFTFIISFSLYEKRGS